MEHLHRKAPEDLRQLLPGRQIATDDTHADVPKRHRLLLYYRLEELFFSTEVIRNRPQVHLGRTHDITRCQRQPQLHDISERPARQAQCREDPCQSL